MFSRQILFPSYNLNSLKILLSLQNFLWFLIGFLLDYVYEVCGDGYVLEDVPK
nr:MAG TPA: hypothetical protein [Bacteriophage sp.]